MMMKIKAKMNSMILLLSVTNDVGVGVIFLLLLLISLMMLSVESLQRFEPVSSSSKERTLKDNGWITGSKKGEQRVIKTERTIILPGAFRGV